MYNRVNALRHIFSSYISVFLLDYSYLGIILALVTCLHPNIGISGLVGLFITAILLKILKLPLYLPIARAALRNAMLVGLLIGDLFIITPEVLILLTIATIFNLMVTAALDSIFAYQRLPVLSLPFCVSALLIFMIKYNLYEVAHFGNAPFAFTEFEMAKYIPSQLLAFLRAVSSILCVRDAVIGCLILAVVTVISPLTTFFIVTGFFIGTTAESQLHVVTSSPLIYSEGYNYSLIFAAIAGFLMVPSYTSFLLATFSTIITSAIIVAFGYVFHPLYLPILSLPFNFMFLITILSLKRLCPQLIKTSICHTPEQSLEKAHLLWNRHRWGEVGIFLPVEGKWKIQQGFEGDITHRGLWKHALDFVSVDEHGKSFYNKGLELTDYISFGKAVLSPLEGYVVACVVTEPDNLVGQVKNCNNWGNYIIIRSYDGIYITLAHLKQHSIAVNINDKVYAGQILGECGNSGYSQEPHLHLQVHIRHEIGAETIPFNLLNYSVENTIYFHGIPKVGEVVSSINFNQAINKTLDFKIGQEMKFDCHGIKQKNVILTYEMNEATGSRYLTDGISRLYCARVGAQHYFYGLEGDRWSPIWDLFAAAPRIPMTYGVEFIFSDELPICITQKILHRCMSYIRMFFKLPIEKSCGRYQINKHGTEISGYYYKLGRNVRTYCKIDPLLAIQEFSIGEKSYIRKQ